MKANEAPEKIYIHPDIGGREFLRPWLRRAANNESVEYNRTDAFIEQMKAWLMDNSANYMMYDPLTSSACLEVEKMIADFEEYLKK